MIAPRRCQDCGGLNGAHGLVHVRYGNGWGGNRPCPQSVAEHHPRCYQTVGGIPDGLPPDTCDCKVWRLIDDTKEADRG